MLLNLNNRILYPTRLESGPAEVWTKPTWSAPFTLRPDLIPVQSVWAAAPDVATAALEYRYGTIILPGTARHVVLDRITARGYFVLIRWAADDGPPIDWLGYAETPVTREHTPARGGMPPTGRQTIRCLGLLRALQQAYIDSTVYADPAAEGQARRSGGTGAIFNEGLRGNRSAEKMRIGDATEGPSAYVFVSANAAESTWWSTRDIVEHLAAFHLPTPSSVAESGGVPWTITGIDALPNWDRPVMDTDLRNVASILDELLMPSRLLGYCVGGNVTGSAPPVVGAVTIEPFTSLTTPLALPAGTMPANPRRVDIAAMADPMTEITADADATAVVDQVIVQGPREVAVGTFAADGPNAAWEKGWSAADESAYATGGAGADDWDELEQSDKRKRNEEIRTRGDGLGKMRNVYSLFRLRQDWDWKTGGEPVMHPGDDDEAYRPCPFAVEFLLDELPLYVGVDYSGDPAAVDESAGRDRMPPMWFYGPDDLLWPMFRRSHELEPHAQELPFRGFTVSPQFEYGPAVRLVVSGAPQHALAGKDFEGNDADVHQETVFGDYPPDTWRVVIAVRGDRRPRYAIPAPDAVAHLDVVRRKVITFEDPSLTSVYIAKNTPVGWDENGMSKHSDGGLLRDPTPILRSLCELMHRQFGQPRYTAQVTTARRLSSLRVGSMLGTVDTESSPINAPITTMTLTAPIADDGTPVGRTTQSITAAAYPGDILQMLRGQNPAAVRRRQRLAREQAAERTARRTARANRGPR